MIIRRLLCEVIAFGRRPQLTLWDIMAWHAACCNQEQVLWPEAMLSNVE